MRVVFSAAFQIFAYLLIVIQPASAQTIVRVPQDVATLQSAIDTVPDGGIIEIAAGTYDSPFSGFTIQNEGKAFTIRAAGSAEVVLNGGGTRNILTFFNGSFASGGPVTFIGLTFRDGFSITNGRSGGISLENAQASFIDCNFENNVTNPSNSGGGAIVMTQSEVFFDGCLWDGNSSTRFGGGVAVFESEAWIHDSQFLNNRTNLPGHVNTSTGGAVSVSAAAEMDSVPAKLRVTNTRFEGNQTGFAGGALYGIGTWVNPVTTPRSDLLVTNSTFEDNLATPAGGVFPPSPTEGGAIHSEDQTTTRVYNSRFLTNEAQIGGGVNAYRAITEVHKSVLRGNRATGTSTGGFGGAVSATSNDTAGDGATNRRSASVTITDSLIEGRFDTTTTAALTGAGVFVAGDLTRNYGLGISQGGTTAQNRATLVMNRVALHECEATDAGGGGLAADLVDLTATEVLVTDSSGTQQGGALRLATQTEATISDSTFAKNTAGTTGGAIFLSGSALDLSDSNLVENDGPSGSALRSDPKTNLLGVGVDAPVTGTVSGSVLSNNTTSVTVFETDSDSGPINDLRYNDNTFHHTGSNSFFNPLTFSISTAALNTVTVNRASAADTVKSQVDNTAAGTSPVVGEILAVPPQILPTTAAGDVSSSTDSFLLYAWSGGSATLNGAGRSGNTGFQGAGAATHTLSVNGAPFTATISSGTAPAGTFTATPGSGNSVTLQWQLSTGTYLDMAIDQGVSVTSPAASGTQVVTAPALPTTYRLFFVTEEGGLVLEATANDANFLFADGFESGNTSQWSVSVP